MTAAATDRLQPVHYSRDRVNVDRLPVALFMCFVGVVLLTYGDPPPPGRLWIVALGFLGIVVAVFCVSLLFTYALHWLSPVAGLGLVLIGITTFLLAFGLPTRRSTPNPTDTAFVALLSLTMGVTWLTWVITRHFFPPRPQLAFSRDGITYRHGGGAEMVIPWHEVQGVTTRFELGPPGSFADATTVLISQDFYDRVILPKYTVFQAPGWESTFRAKEAPKGPVMQMALHHLRFHVEASDIREPLEARWTAFRDVPKSSVPSVPPARAAAPEQAPRIHGRWSGELTRWQMVKLALPMVGLLAVATNATGLWDTGFLRGLREERAAKVKRYEDAAAEQRRYREEFRRSNEAAAERERRSREIERQIDRAFAR